MTNWHTRLKKIDDCRWRIPRSYKPGMRVDGLIYADERTDRSRSPHDQAPEQVANVAFLPGIQSASLAMPDIHWGYGFCIGGVAATDPDEGGVVSPGGVGYDINCGVRLRAHRTCTIDDVQPQMPRAGRPALPRHPRRRRQRRAVSGSTQAELRRLMAKGAVVDRRTGSAGTSATSSTPRPAAASTAPTRTCVSRARRRARRRPVRHARRGNHFLEVQVVDEIFDAEAAAGASGWTEARSCVMIHSGSRGWATRSATTPLASCATPRRKYGIEPARPAAGLRPGRQSPEGQQYLGAMRAAANYAWANRQLLMWQAREVFAQVFGRGVGDARHGPGLRRGPQHRQDRGARRSTARSRRSCVHRKGATRAFPAGHPEVPAAVPADRPAGASSPATWAGRVGAGRRAGQHGARPSARPATGPGRLMSRTAAMKRSRGDEVQKDLESKGIIVRAQSRGTLPEEASYAYKDVSDVVDAVPGAGIARKVAKMRPLGVVKG